MNQGLRPKTKDDRDFKVGQLLDLPELKDIPYEICLIKNPIIKDQRDTDFCAAFAATSLSEIQEGIELSPEWQFAVTKMIEGDPNSWGAELRDVCKSLVKYGSLPQSKAAMSLKNTPASVLRDIKNWDKNLFLEALPFRKQTFLSVEGKYDHFDNIRAYITYFYNRGQKNGVLLGLEWGWNLSSINIDTPSVGGFGHAVGVSVGFVGERLAIQQSAGVVAGNKGIQYIHRNVVNKYVEDYGAFTFIDIPRDIVEYHIAAEVKIKENPFILIINTLASICQNILNVFLKN